MNKDIKMFHIIKKLVDKISLLFLPIYFISYLIPRNKKIWLFGSNMGRSFGDNPKYFYLYMNHNKKDNIRSIWISGDNSIVQTLRDKGYESYCIYSLKGIFFAMCGGVYIFDHHTKDICFWFSGGAKKINLFHGIPLKKIHGDNKFDEVRNPPSLFKNMRWAIRRLQNEQPSHYYLATSEYVRDIFKGAFRTSGDKGIVSGYPRNDIFYDVGYLSDKERLITVENELFDNLIEEKMDANNKLVLYMPTFRQSESELLDIMDFRKFNEFLESNNLIFLIKAHPMSKMNIIFDDINYSNILNIIPEEDPYPFLTISDILITDYSSVYFDFLLTNKPIIFFPYDLETYLSESRELYYEYGSVTPGPKVKNMEELIKQLAYHKSGNDDYEVGRRKILDMMFDYDDGNSSERLYNKIIDII